MITDTSGNVLEQRGHCPYGETRYEGNPNNKLKFTSYERDVESGNDYAVFRYHISRAGRLNSQKSNHLERPGPGYFGTGRIGPAG